MEKLTYKQAYNKIIDAYFKDEIKPMDLTFCFCGTLSPDNRWAFQPEPNKYPYSSEEYRRMEHALLTVSNKLNGDKWHNKLCLKIDYDNYEDDLFIGMSEALIVLKQIHIGRGENVDEEITPFTKRKLANHENVEVV